MELHIGKITHLQSSGLGHLVEEGTEGTIHPFTFDRIEGYHGESLRELAKKNVKVGSIVMFALSPDSKIASLRPLVFRAVLGWF